jgi:hypothetical protein
LRESLRVSSTVMLEREGRRRSEAEKSVFSPGRRFGVKGW